MAQSEEVKKISAWAAILFAPTLIGTVYGMNFETCRSWAGCSATRSRSADGGVSLTLYAVFKRRDWI